ncbi:MAG: hypothetical protein WC673_02905 [Candidatus Paceibacterota bacterium]|jgi:hypothetical protein
MIINIILFVVFIVTLMFFRKAMRLKNQCRLYKLAPNILNEYSCYVDTSFRKEIADAKTFIKQRGGLELVTKRANLGVSYGAAFAILSLFVLVLRFIFL